MLRELGKSEAAQVGSKPPNRVKKPERFTVIVRSPSPNCVNKEKAPHWLVKSILRIQIRVLRKHCCT